MRISLLEKREDFYKILELTLSETDYFPSDKKSYSQFYVNRYLNFIATLSLNEETFKILKNEYSNSVSLWKKYAQKIYVYLAINKKSRNFLSHKTILISKKYDKFLILGGNHRIRIFPEDLSFSLLLLKKNENVKFIRNDLEVRLKHNLSYCPKILEQKESWIKEEYFEGFPLNRIDQNRLREKVINSLIVTHWSELIKISMFELDIKSYKNKIFDEVKYRIKDNSKLIKKIIGVIDLVFDLIPLKKVQMAYTHGDFQNANILINSNDAYKVIDWEHADTRFYLYDFFILNSQQRKTNNINQNLEINQFHYLEDLLGVKIYNYDVYFFIIEEIRYFLNERFSQNYKTSEKETFLFFKNIEDFLKS